MTELEAGTELVCVPDLEPMTELEAGTELVCVPELEPMTELEAGAELVCVPECATLAGEAACVPASACGANA
jgi:hypothetical protein